MTKSTSPEDMPNKLVQQVQGSGNLLHDTLARCSNFNWEIHMQWLHDKSPKIKALNKKYPPNNIYKIIQEGESISGAIVYIDGYTESSIGVTPIGTTFVLRVKPEHLLDVTVDVKNGIIKEEDIAAMLAKWATPPDTNTP
jgi:hypothetical protein